MKIEKKTVTSLPFPYSVSIFKGLKPDRVFAAPEKRGQCVNFALDGTDVKVVWEGGLGGTTGICQLHKGGNSFLAIEGAYKGFQCEGAGIVHGVEKDGAWQIDRICNLPFAHRMCVVQIEEATFVVVATLCGGKQSKDDWSQPGAVYIGRWAEDAPASIEFTKLIEGIHQNHGMYKGLRDGRQVILISGKEGLFEIEIPDRAEDAWTYKTLIGEPISDICPYDIDGDGLDEMIAISGFHGNEMLIYKSIENAWRQVYAFPVSFGHFVWGGEVLGRRSIITGYRGANGALVLFQKRPDEFKFDISCLDELEAPINMEVLEGEDRTILYTTSGGQHRVMRYVLTRD